MKQEITKEMIIIFLRKQWKPVLLAGLVIVSIVIVILIPGKNNTPQQAAPAKGINNTIGNHATATSPQPSKKPSNLFGFLSDPKKNDAISKQPANSSGNNTNNKSTSASIPSTITKINPNGTKTTQNLTPNGTTQTTQGSINPQSNIQTDIARNTQEDNIRIVFKNPDGTTFTYIPPGTPPDEVRWGRYTNKKSNYAINYPSNWQFSYSINSEGFEGIAMYPPNTNPNDPKTPRIGFGLSKAFLLPVAESGTNSYVTPLKVDGISGNLYTNGPLGNSYIASVLQYSGNYFGLGSSISNETFAYVYYYMLNSLTFNIE